MSLKVEGYPYKYEVHMHTYEGSACGKTHAEEYISAFIEQGYDGIIITDHFYHGNTRIDRSLPWEDFVEEFAKDMSWQRPKAISRDLRYFSAGKPTGWWMST